MPADQGDGDLKRVLVGAIRAAGTNGSFAICRKKANCTTGPQRILEKSKKFCRI
jgi:hypothetical protein